MIVSDQVSMGVVTEGSIGRILAVAQLIIATLSHIIGYGAVTSDSSVATAVACRIGLR